MIESPRGGVEKSETTAHQLWSPALYLLLAKEKVNYLKIKQQYAGVGGWTGRRLWNKQDKVVIYNISKLRLNKERSSLNCHPQENQIAWLKTLDWNKWTTSCLLISLFWFWQWNQQVPRSHRHSHIHWVTPGLYVFKWLLHHSKPETWADLSSELNFLSVSAAS